MTIAITRRRKGKQMNERALNRLTGRNEWRNSYVREDDENVNRHENEWARRRANERRRHQFADNIGGHSSNYKAPYFGRG